MSETAAGYVHRRHLTFAALLGLLGLGTAVAYMVHTTPYTMALFLIVGVGLILAAVSLYAFVIVRDIRARLDGVLEKRFGKGDVVFRQGDAGDRLYVIAAGEAEVVRENPDGSETPIARLAAGAYFGEMALLTSAPRNSTVRAATDLATLSIHQSDFTSLYTHVPAMRESIEAVMRQRRPS